MDDLLRIFAREVARSSLRMADDGLPTLSAQLAARLRRPPENSSSHFSNGRFVRTVYEQGQMALRLRPYIPRRARPKR